MKRWVQKAIVQKTISYLPFSHRINYLFQKFVTRGVYLSDEYLIGRLEHARNHLHYYHKYTGNKSPGICLEIGTGWYPVVPVCFFLSGSDKIYSVDITFLTSKTRLHTTLTRIYDYYQSGKLGEYIQVLPSRLQAVENILQHFDNITLDEVLRKLHIHYVIGDARKLPLPDNSIDLVNSNNTFEHIYPAILKPILLEFKRVVKKKAGVMSHAIDMSDHFAHFDKSINIYNFLRFSDSQWKWIDNFIQPQSRLRMYDYRNMYKDLNIPTTELSFEKGDVELLNQIPLSPEYQSATAGENAVSHCHIVSDMSRVNE